MTKISFRNKEITSSSHVDIESYTDIFYICRIKSIIQKIEERMEKDTTIRIGTKIKKIIETRGLTCSKDIDRMTKIFLNTHFYLHLIKTHELDTLIEI